MRCRSLKRKMNSLLLVLLFSSTITALDILEHSTARIVLKFIENCANPEEFLICLKRKAAMVLDKLKRSDQISISDSVKIVRSVNHSVTSDKLTEVKLDEILPAATEEKNTLLNQMLSEELMNLFRSSTLEISLPKQINGKVKREGESMDIFVKKSTSEKNPESVNY